MLFIREKLKGTYRKMEDPKAGASLKSSPQHNNDLQSNDLEPWSSLHDLQAIQQAEGTLPVSPYH